MIAFAGKGEFDAQLQDGPQKIEISEMQDFCVEEFAPVRLKGFGCKETCNDEEQWHAERAHKICEIDQPHITATQHGLGAQRDMHRHHHHDGEALGGVNPIDTSRYGRCGRERMIGALGRVGLGHPVSPQYVPKRHMLA